MIPIEVGIDGMIEAAWINVKMSKIDWTHGPPSILST